MISSTASGPAQTKPPPFFFWGAAEVVPFDRVNPLTYKPYADYADGADAGRTGPQNYLRYAMAVAGHTSHSRPSPR